jgi:hypothetical protein
VIKMATRKSIKEEFAKFCESPDRTKFRELLKQNTGEYPHLFRINVPPTFSDNLRGVFPL